MAKNKIKEGDKAPIFKYDSYNKGTIDLAELIGKQKIVLIFSRYFGCPLCQMDLKTLLANEEKIEEKGARILYITQSSESFAKEFIDKENITFPVIQGKKIEGSKNEYLIYSDYGLGKMVASAAAKVPLKIRAAKKMGIKHGDYEKDTVFEYQCPGQFVIDTDGTIIHAKKGWLNIEAILNSL